MQSKEVTVRLQVLGGTWEVCGRDRKRGVWPENVRPGADGWGSAVVNFDLRRNPRAPWPDLGAYTPVEIEIGGQVVWSGRIADTPTRDGPDRVISVQCKGWQVQLDDDVYEKAYVHSKLSDWKDARGFPSTNLVPLPQRLSANVQAGQITLGATNGTVWAAGTGVGVVLDLGPSSTARRVVLSVKRPAASGSALTALFVRGMDTPDPLTGAGTLDFVSNVAVTTIPTAATFYSGTIASGRRYVAIFLYNGTGYTANVDDLVTILSVQVFGAAAYENFNGSVLKASTVVIDALAQATDLLSSDLSGITASTFSIPDLVLDSPQTPREVWSSVNAYHDYLCQIDVRGRPIFKPKPTAPIFEVGAWSPLEPEDQSANSGDEIYSRVMVTGTQPDGTPLRVTRTGSGTHRVLPFPDAGPWTGGAAVSDPAPSISVSAFASFAWQAGVTYTVTALVKRTTNVTNVTLKLIVGGVTVTSGPLTPTVGVYTPVTLSITPAVASNNASIGLDSTGATGTRTINLDAIAVLAPGSSLPDRRGFTRTKQLVANRPTTVAVAQTIGDLWLASHTTTPFKGTFKITGDRAVRDPATGTPVPLEQLLLNTGELIRDVAAIDPDTGGIGRDGRIASVDYDPETDSATVTLDNSRASFEALLARLDIVGSAGK